MSNTEANQPPPKTGETLDNTVDCLYSQPVPTQHRKNRSKLASSVLKNGSAANSKIEQSISASSESNQPLPTCKHDKLLRGITNKENLSKNPAMNKSISPSLSKGLSLRPSLHLPPTSIVVIIWH
jgi:hypothetical protein